VWVMDSSAMNALAHYINLALFLMGSEPDCSAALLRVEAELYRANLIENYDTCGIRITTETGATLLVLLTHACGQTHEPVIQLQGEAGGVEYLTGKEAHIRGRSGESTLELSRTLQVDMVRRFARLVRADADDTPTATLDVARAHLAAVNGASEASPVHAVDPSDVQVIERGGAAQLRVIPRIEGLFEHCFRQGLLPHESGLAGWTRPASGMNLSGYRFFSVPAEG